jgi:hypothetical protein
MGSAWEQLLTNAPAHPGGRAYSGGQIRSYRARRRGSVGRGSHFVFADRRDAKTTSALVVSVVTENPNLEPHRL